MEMGLEADFVEVSCGTVRFKYNGVPAQKAWFLVKFPCSVLVLLSPFTAGKKIRSLSRRFDFAMVDVLYASIPRFNE